MSGTSAHRNAEELYLMCLFNEVGWQCIGQIVTVYVLLSSTLLVLII